jgi:O-antigen/teichoic acid export membrane protein
LNTAGGAAISRLCSSLNSFVVGKKFKAFLLGNYGYAEDLAGLPLNKIWPMFQQVAFPLLSRLQNDPPERDKTFLDYLKYCSYLTFPLFIVGAIFSKELILGLLGQKWVQIYPLFSVFCIVKLLDMLCEFGNLLFLTTGKTNTILRYNVYRLIITPSTLFIAALYGYKYLLVPWATVYPLFCVIWIIYTLKKYKIKIGHYISNLYRPLLVSAVFMANYFIVKSGLVYFRGVFPNERLFVIVILSVAGLLSLLFVILFDKKTVNALLKLKSSESK